MWRNNDTLNAGVVLAYCKLTYTSTVRMTPLQPGLTITCYCCHGNGGTDCVILYIHMLTMQTHPPIVMLDSSLALLDCPHLKLLPVERYNWRQEDEHVARVDRANEHHTHDAVQQVGEPGVGAVDSVDWNTYT